METKIRQTQTFAPALPSPASTPHHSDNEESEAQIKPPKTLLLEVIVVYEKGDHCAGQKAR